MSDLVVIDNFLDDFEHVCDCAYHEEYYSREASNKIQGIQEGWTGTRTLDIKTRYSNITKKIEESFGIVVEKMHFYKIEGEEKQWLWDNQEQALRPHKDAFPLAGVVYLWGNTGTYYDGELIEFAKNRAICYNGQHMHMPELTDKDRCVIVFFGRKQWRNF